MKKRTIVSAIMLLATAFTLSGCLFPYWDDDGREYRGGGERHGGHHDEGRHH
jgi:hypothetical protein